jgi:hypothetical protein
LEGSNFFRLSFDRKFWVIAHGLIAKSPQTRAIEKNSHPNMIV